MTLISDLAEVGVRARRRVACRLLPFVFLIYVVNYIDRVNVSFADLRPRGNFVVNSSSSDWHCRNARQNGWHSDKTGERRLHAAIPLLIAASMYGSLIAARHNIGL